MFIIDKIFNFKIDTKNKNVSTVTGFKQFDNNSVLNITLLQNSLALDLSNCTVRLNFLREDERVLLYMANIVSAKEGEVSIKLSPEVLEKNGLVKADISVFDSNLFKITSTTFNLKVEKSIFDDTYFTDKDLDLMQQEYIREKERQDNENNRKANESNRTQAETKRGQNENTRISNEEDRKKAENTRVSEWNNVKKDANNIKNTLDTTIDTANKSNSNLQSTIDKADTTTYATKGEFNKLTTQYEDIEKQLKNSSTKSITKNSNIIDLENNVEGIANIAVAGNTVDVNKEPILSDFKNKVKGSTAENPNVAKRAGNYTKLLNPNEFNTECEYNNIQGKNGDCLKQSVDASNGYIPQQLFSFDLIKIIEKEKGTIPGSSTKEKVEWLKKNIESITCNWWGYGECSTGNIAYLKPFKADESKWLEWGKATSTNVAKVTVPLLNVHYYINNDGFVSFLALTDASDGKTPSVIYTDYINLEVKLNPILKSVGEKEKQVEVKSVGKNLFNPMAWKTINGKENTIITQTKDGINIKTNGKTAYCCPIYHINLNPNTTYNFSCNFKRVKGTGSIELKEGTRTYCKTDNKISFNFMTNGTTNPTIIQFNANEMKLEESEIEITNIQLEEGTKITPYEPYKEDKTTMRLEEPLRGLLNGVRDTLNSDGAITRRIGKVVLDGSEDWTIQQNKETTVLFGIENFTTIYNATNNSNILSDTFAEGDYANHNLECIKIKKDLNFQISKIKLSESNVDGFKKWLKENPVAVYYELKEPVVESVGQPLGLKTFEGGHIVTDTDIPSFITVNYPTNMSSRISSIESAEKYIKDSLGGAWKTLLILADKELKMKSIKTLETETNKDIKNKINEILEVW